MLQDQGTSLIQEICHERDQTGQPAVEQHVLTAACGMQ
jgi:hypothetical protein